MKYIVSALLLWVISITSLYAATKTPMEAANFLADLEIIAKNTTIWDTQMSDEAFYRLSDTITRQEVAKVVSKLAEAEIVDVCVGKFSDVTSGWGCKYIEWMLDNDLIAANSTYRPLDNITKTEAMKLVLKSKGISKSQETDNWQADYMETAYEYGIIEEKYYDYNADATRGWIFVITTSTIEKEEEIKEIIEEKEKLMSDEAMLK